MKFAVRILTAISLLSQLNLMPSVNRCVDGQGMIMIVVALSTPKDNNTHTHTYSNRARQRNRYRNTLCKDKTISMLYTHKLHLVHLSAIKLEAVIALLPFQLLTNLRLFHATMCLCGSQQQRTGFERLCFTMLEERNTLMRS